MTTKYDITIPQSGVFRLVVAVANGPADLTGFTGEMQVRSSKGSAVVLADVDASAFAVDNPTRMVTVTIPSTATALYNWGDNAVYDMYIVNGTERWRLLEGLARLSKTVTRD